jgi:Fur family ferric uptake transcriptional regulator
VAVTVDSVLEQLRADGGRITTARRLLVKELLRARGHVTAEKLVKRVQASQPDVAESTIYRILDSLERLGVIVHTHLGHGPAVYHLAEESHGHLVCDHCGAVIEVPLDLLGKVTSAVREHHRFEIGVQHFAIGGTCSRCLGSRSPAATTLTAPEGRARASRAG